MKVQNIALILRGVSGSGKTSFAEFLKKSVSADNVVTCTADDYFVQDGQYKFDPTKLGTAHAYCFRKFERALEAKKQLVIQNNTNTNPKDFVKYKEAAEKAGYQVFVLVCENRHGNENVHNVPEQALKKQFTQLSQSIKLLP